MSALAVETSIAEDAFLQLAAVASDGVAPVGSAVGRTCGSSDAAALTRPARQEPRVRLVPAPSPARPAAARGPVAPAVPTLRRRVQALRACDRELVLESADEAGPLPAADAQNVACGLALAAVEVLAGRRPVAQLARWLTPGVYEALRMRAALTAQAIGARAGAGRHTAIRRARACPVAPGVVEVAVVTDDGSRVRAVAVRLEAWRGQWRATALEIG